MAGETKAGEVGGTGRFPRNRRISKLLVALLVFGVFMIVLILPGRHAKPSTSLNRSMPAVSEIELPTDLETLTLAQFDRLVHKGGISYEESELELVESQGFQFQFRIVSFLDKKPISAPDSANRAKAGGPFENPRPEEIVTNVGSSHRLLLNKYCIYRPMLVLPTIQYAPQTDDLNESDIAAAWSVLRAFSTPQIVIYNCGANAGSSIGHKHLQIFPLPSNQGRMLFPSQAKSTEEIERRISNVPFKHYILRIVAKASAAAVFKQYQALLVEVREALAKSKAGADYNVVFTEDWIALIPRRTAVWGGPFGANAAGMVGMVTVPTPEQRDEWADLGYVHYLTKLGIPLD